MEAAQESAPTLNSEPTAPVEDGWLDTASGAATSTVMEPNTDPVPCEAHDSEAPDSLPDSEPPAPLPIKSDWAPVMEFTAANIFQHSPFGDIIKSLKSLSLSGDHEEPAPIRPWNATSSYDVYMVDTPKENNSDNEKDPVEDYTPEIQTKR